MKKALIIIFITSMVLLISCTRQTESVALTPNISVKLPVNHKMAKQVHGNKEYTLYGAMVNNDKIFISQNVEIDLDTFSLEEKKAANMLNIHRYMETFNGRNLENSEKIIGSLLQSDFNFEFDKTDTTFMIFGRLILQDSVIIILSYESVFPVSTRSANDKEKFFNAIKYKE